MARLPKEARDLVLAPLAVEVDLNLQRLRGKAPSEIEFVLEQELDQGPVDDDRAERAERIRRFALRNVTTHGWDVEVTDDNAAVRLKGGSVSLDLALGAGAMRFLEEAGA